jgi:hypothetical protein
MDAVGEVRIRGLHGECDVIGSVTERLRSDVIGGGEGGDVLRVNSLVASPS